MTSYTHHTPVDTTDRRWPIGHQGGATYRTCTYKRDGNRKWSAATA
jgi:hypothetical protein